MAGPYHNIADEEELDYKFDFDKWLPAGIKITTYTLTPDPEITIVAHQKSDGDRKVWFVIEPNAPTINGKADVKCVANTDASLPGGGGHTIERTMTFTFKETIQE